MLAADTRTRQDEFDIFMDDVHRTLTIKMLIEFARNNPARQFIFLSPLDTSAIPKNASGACFVCVAARRAAHRAFADIVIKGSVSPLLTHFFTCARARKSCFLPGLSKGSSSASGSTCSSGSEDLFNL